MYPSPARLMESTTVKDWDYHLSYDIIRMLKLLHPCMGGNRTQAKKARLRAACQTFMIKNPVLNTLAYQLT